ncbi:MAG: Rpn family recombination-promoting nuclease/putative transposase [Roseivirga sp.]
MSEISINNPHDTFFRRSLSDLAVSKDFLKRSLRPDLVERIDWDSLQMSNQSFVKEALKELHSDLVYTCRIDGKEAYLYCLIEHQSTPDPLMPFRLLQYNVAIMEEHLSQGHQRLPLIANLCLYSGQQAPYPYTTDIFDCFEEPTLARALMFKPFTLIDLSAYSEEELAQGGASDLVQILLKHSRYRSYLDWINKHPRLIEALLKQAYGISGVLYILGTEEQDSSEAIIKAISEIIPEKKEAIMTAAQQLVQKGMQQGMQKGMQQGMQKGMQQGMQKGIQQVAKSLLSQLHLDLKAVQKATGLSQEALERLQKEE